MLLPENLVEGEFLERLNRFSALVKIKSKEIKVYLPNSGRMKELLLKGARVYLSPSHKPERTTSYDLLLVMTGKMLVSVDSRVPNRLLEEYFRKGILPGFEKHRLLRREVKYSRSRLDFLLENNSRLCYVEAKSVTLNKNGTAFFPDAPTERGRHHLQALIQLLGEGHQACIIFVAQRADSLYFSPNDETDPEFGRILRKAIALGVEARAYRCLVTPEKIEITGKIPVLIR